MSEAGRLTTLDDATGCWLWLGPVDAKGPYTSVHGQKTRLRRRVAERHHERTVEGGYLEAVCARVLIRPGAPSLCISPHHAIAKRPSKMAERRGLARADWRALRDLMASQGRRGTTGLAWKVTDLARMNADRAELEGFAAVHGIDYWAAFAVWSELSRASWRALKHGPV